MTYYDNTKQEYRDHEKKRIYKLQVIKHFLPLTGKR